MDWTLIAYGVLGGIVGEFYTVAVHRTTPKNERPEYLFSLFYWVIGFVWVLVGGILVAMYINAGNVINGYLAFNVGITAPLIVEGLVRKAPSLSMPGSSNTRDE